MKQTIITNTTSTSLNLKTLSNCEFKEEDKTVISSVNTLFSEMNEDEINNYINSATKTKAIAELHRLIAHYTDKPRKEVDVDELIENLNFQIEGMIQDIEYLKSDVIFLQSFKTLLK